MALALKAFDTYRFFILLSLFLSSGCTQNTQYNKKITKIDLSNAIDNRKEIPLSRFAESICYIPLETNDSCLADKIRKIVINQDRIYITDLKVLFIFDIEGRYITKISNIGRGPGEYMNIWDFELSENGSFVIIYSDESKKILIYNNDGKFLNEFRIDFFPSKISCIRNDKIVAAWPFPDFTYNENNRLSLLDYTGNTSGHYKASESEIGKPVNARLATSASSFNKSHGSVTYFEQGFDTILEITSNGKIFAKYLLGYVKMFGDNNDNKINALNYLETNNYVFFPNCLYNGDLVRIIYDKRSSETFELYFDHSNYHVRILAGFINDIDGGFPFVPQGITSNEEVFCYFDVFDLDVLVDLGVVNPIFPAKTTYMKGNVKIADLLKLPYENNPIVMLVKLK